VLLNNPLSDTRHSTVTIDSYRGARAMVRHLVARGRRRIAHIAGPDLNYDSHERLRGFVDEMAASVPEEQPIILKGDFGERSGYLAGQQLSSPGERPDAVFAANDIMAVGCLIAFREAGVHVPDDVALVGFDDIPIAALVSPTLTTMRVRIADLGQSALTHLLLSIDSPKRTRRVAQAFQPELVVRESCGAEEPGEPQKRRRRRPVVGVS
jgi:LacI family transcriptional regulator